LKITKKVLANGKETTVDDIFYAGIFKTDAEGNRELLKVIVLEQNKTVVTNVPLDLVKGIVVKTEYEVLETDKNGKPIGEEFPYNVSGEGLVVVESPDIAGEITIVNECIEQETESESTTETQKESETNTSVVETGDDTPIEGYMILLAVSLLVVIVMLGVKKEKR